MPTRPLSSGFRASTLLGLALAGAVLAQASIPLPDLPAPPVIILEPQDQAVEPGATVTFSVEASGTPPLAYQWWLGDERLPGATNTMLVLAGVQPFDSGSYQVVITNAFGSATTRAAVLVVLGAPEILTQPQSVKTATGSNVTLTVEARGLSPLTFQWQHEGTPLASATNAMLQLAGVGPEAAGVYRVAISNDLGWILSAAASLTVVDYVEDHTRFHVLTLTNAGSRILGVDPLTDERGGIAASSSRLFLCGTTRTTSRTGIAAYTLPGLSSVALLPHAYDIIVSDLRTERVYALADGDIPMPAQGGLVTALLELDGETGAPTGRKITLTQPVEGYFGGLFAGYGRIVIVNHLFDIYEVQLPSGFVRHLGFFGFNDWQQFQHIHPDFYPDPPHTPNSPFGTWAFWGVAERVDDVLWLVYVQDRNTIIRRRVPDGHPEVAARYYGSYNLGYADLARFTVSPRANRWYFHHEDLSAFYFDGAGGFIALPEQTVGYANAAFAIDSGIYPARYEWGPLLPLQPANLPVTVTLLANTTSRGPATNFHGPVSLTATAPGGRPIAIEPTVLSGFVDGVWTGAVTILEPASNIVLRAEDEAGVTATSAPFTVSTNDLAVFVEDTPDPAPINGELTYSITVISAGPDNSTGVWLTNTLPPQVDFVDATTSAGACTHEAGVVICNWPSLPRGDRAEATIRILPALVGWLTNTVAVGRNEPDPVPANNHAEAVTVITGPLLVVDDLETPEADTGSHPVTFTIRLLQSTTNTVTVLCHTAAGTADNRDFTAAQGVLTFPPNVTTQTFTVQVQGDALYEVDETFTLNLSQPAHASLGRPQGVCTLRDNDPMPTVRVTGATLTEGDTGTNLLSFRVQFSSVAGVPLLARYATGDLTASAGDDYAPLTGEIALPPHFQILTRTVRVPVFGDTRAEADEQFEFRLVAVSNALVEVDVATGTILDDDFDLVWEPIASPQAANAPIPVTLSARFFDGTPVTQFTGSVNFTAFAPAPRLTGTMMGSLSPQAQEPGDFTIGHDFILSEDVYVTHVRHFRGTKISVWDSQGAPVFSRNVISQGLWQTTPLDTPVWLRAGKTYRIGFYTGGPDSPYAVTGQWTADFKQGILGNRWFQVGDGYPLRPINDPVIFLVDLVYEFDQPQAPVPMSPAVSGPFSEGAWTGELQVANPATNVSLRAQAGTGHRGLSNPFDVLAVVGADLELAISASANPLPASNTVVFKMYVANHGPGAATHVVLTNPLPAGLTLLSAWTSHGTVNPQPDLLVVELGSLPPGTQGFITTELFAEAEGHFTNTATLFSSVHDPQPANNAAKVVLTVCADCDADGIPDAWEHTYGLDPRDPADADLDPDGDGRTNRVEYDQGTNPWFSDLPLILADPADQSANTGDDIAFTVVAEGTEPLSHQWFRYGQPVPGATNATLTLTNIQFAANGLYAVRVSNPFGESYSQTARLVMDSHLTFRLTDLADSSVLIADADALAGDDHYGLAVSSNSVFVTGVSSARWDADTLGNGAALDQVLAFLVCDLQTETVYALAAGTEPLIGAGNCNALLALDAHTGTVTTNRIGLDPPFSLAANSGLFAGYGRLVVQTGGMVYSIDPTSGVVSPVAGLPLPVRQTTESGAYWGVAEYFDGSVHLVYVRDPQTIIRTRVPENDTRLVAEFTDLGTQMAAISFSPSLSRWFFYHELASQFSPSGFPDTVGSAAAAFTTSPEYPWIVTGPADVAGYQDLAATFTVEATGGAPLGYQWLFEGQPIPGATGPSFTRDNLRPTDAGRYTVIVGNSIGSVRASATLQVLGAPVLLEQPQSLTVALGATATFSVTAEGAPPLAYEWRFQGNPLPQATNASLAVAGASTNSAGTYTVRVSNGHGAVLSQPAVLTVIDASQFFDDFEPDIDRPLWLEFGGNPGETLATNYAGSVSSSHALWFGADSSRHAHTIALNTQNGGTIAFWLRISAAAGGYPWENADSGEDVVLEYLTDTAGDWVRLGTYDTEEFPEWTRVELDIPVGAQTPGTQFRWRQLSHSGRLNDHWALDDVLIATSPTPPTIRIQPLAITVQTGRLAHFSVEVSGSRPLAFAWQREGIVLPHATNATLILSNVQPADAGRYAVHVTNLYGAALSAEARLSIAPEDFTRFRITHLGTNDVRTVNHEPVTGDDRGGIAASRSHVFLNGDGSVGRFALADLAGRGAVGSVYDSLITDLRTATVYVLANANTVIASQGTVTTLLQLDGATGQRNSQSIHLSHPLPLATGSGLFSGYGRVLIHTGGRLFSIQLPSGSVTDLGPLAAFPHRVDENGMFYGIAEHDGDESWLVYVQNSQTIARRSVSGPQSQPIASFFNLGEMASITLSVDASRWYFAHENISQFHEGSTGDDILGSAEAQFDLDSGIYPTRLAWDPVSPINPVGTPFPVALRALTSTGEVATNYAGVVTLSAVRSDGLPLPLGEPRVVSFTDGVWTGMVTLEAAAPALTLRAADPEGLAGRSAEFESGNEFAVLLADTPDPLVVNQALTYAITVVNAWTNAATGLWLTNLLPPDVEVIAITASQGSCSRRDREIVCDLGTLGNQTRATVELRVQPVVPGLYTNTVTVRLNEPDANPANNTAVAITTVEGPRLVIDDLSIPEGHSASAPATFTVRLLQPSTNSITVQYATANGTAVAGRDFTGSSGLLTFPPNVTTQTFTVAITGETRYETDETFAVNLFNPDGASLGRPQAIATIVNDDPLPTVTLQDLALREGTGGTTNLAFALRLSAVPGVPVEVTYATADDTAVAGLDYHQQAGSVVFLADFPILNRTIYVTVLRDSRAEPDEAFHLQILSITNAVLATNQAVAVIEDDDFQFVWEPVESPQALQVPFPISVSARTYDGTLVSNFNGTVSLSASAGSVATNTVGNGQNTADYPFGTFYHDQRTQVIYLADEIGSAGRITALALDCTRTPGQTMNAWTIRMKHTPLDRYPTSATWEASGWTTVFRSNLSVPNTGWVHFDLNPPFEYNGRDHLMIDFSFNNSRFTSDGYCRITTHNNIRTLHNQTDSGYGDPLTWTGRTPFPFSATTTPNLRIKFDTFVQVLVSPATSGNFQNGVWSGAMALFTQGTSIRFHATDAENHTGDSNPVDARLLNLADLAVSSRAPTNTAVLGDTFTLQLTVTNLSNVLAPLVVLSNPVPAGFEFVSATTSRGSVTNFAGVIRANLLSFPPAAGAELTLTFRAVAEGAATNHAAVRSNLPDPNPANNLTLLPFEVLCADCDRDGILDLWEREQGLDPGDLADATLDFDDDGMDNLHEFWADTDPWNAQDVLVLQYAPIQEGSPDVSVYFTGLPNRKYALERAPQLAGPWTPIAVFRLGTVPTVRLTDFGAASQAMGVYRVRALARP